MIALSYNTKPISTFEDLIKTYPQKEFDSPFRSTVPLLSRWRDTEQCIVSFCQALGIIPPINFQAKFEYQVVPPKGRGKASHTDLMLLWDATAMAIEAKYTEPPYLTVREWLGTGSSNKRLVLEGWLKLISRAAECLLRLDDVHDLSYQLIHRCASACSRVADTRFVIYLVCDDGSGNRHFDYYREQLKTLRPLLGKCTSLKFVLMRGQFRPKPFYIDLQKKWNAGGREFSEEVIEGLLADKLMEFGSLQTLWISRSQFKAAANRGEEIEPQCR